MSETKKCINCDNYGNLFKCPKLDYRQEMWGLRVSTTADVQVQGYAWCWTHPDTFKENKGDRKK